MLIIWILIFIVSLIVLVKSADWLVESAEKIGLALKISPFIIGITIVAAGTSFPELASSLSAIFKNATEIVAANAIGSNIANILLIVGLSAIAAGHLVVKRSLIDLDSPLLAISTFLFIFIIWDKKVILFEGILLIITFVVYLLYTVSRQKEEKKAEFVEVLPSRIDRREKKKKLNKLNFKVFLFLTIGAVGLCLGANYAIESLRKVSEALKISSSLIAISALAVGTSLPELVVSVRAAAKKKYEIALGNIFGSNIFNILLVVGVPAIIKPLVVDEVTFLIGIPFLLAATLLFIISGISQKIHIWEGIMYLLLYILFISKLYAFF